MQFVGRKLYIAVNENLVVSVSKLSKQWSRFRYEPGKVFFQTAQMADLLGEIFPLGQGPFERHEGEAAASILRDLQAWLGAEVNGKETADWIIGRRMVAGWKPNGMVAFEGLQVPPSKFGLTPTSAVLFDLFEFSDVLMEMNQQKLAIASDVALTDILNGNQYWLPERDLMQPESLPAPSI